MINTQLECVPAWRYCHVRAGEKRPYPANWQQQPVLLKDIDSPNVGLLLGPTSHGVCALDFDGPSSWTWFDRAIGCALPPTTTWTSGKAGRCQMAFQVPTAYWFYLRTLKISHTRDAAIAEGDGFEFRWAGCQSVMPPSRLSDGREYVWLVPPSAVGMALLPDEIVAYWLQQANPDQPPTPARDLSQITQVDLDEIQLLLTQVHAQHPRLNYDAWRTVAWGTAHHVGVPLAQQIMCEYWPEKKPGEYRQLYSGYSPERSPTIGSIRMLAGAGHPVRTNPAYTVYAQQLAELEQLEHAIEQRKKTICCK